ncbi:DinB family protein [Rufibacter ruber]|uniref:DinB family protein n=1 Tax=Rufibacter ruber TaxID=1783499 RepID=UPI0008364E07|nr:DinB family protein [Rufibacter ruber]
MAKVKAPEVWLRGPVANIPLLLQPVAHALLQAKEELEEYLQEFSDDLLWQRPAGVASVGFHLQHLCGVLDRLLTYARGEGLQQEQLHYLSQEGIPPQQKVTVQELLGAFNLQVDLTLAQLTQTPEPELTQPRGVGRAQLPSTVLGLLFHAAEHTQRHVGQLLVTVKILQERAAG